MDYKKLVEPYFEEMFLSLKDFIAINSVYDEKTVTKETPFGKGVDNALSYIASLAEKFGYKVDRCDGYATEIIVGDKGDLLGVYAHADVVPISGKWDTPPFECVLKDDGYFYGRGTSDDKGPLIACLYAIKALKDHGLLDNVTIRFVVGGDEERGSGCLEHYFHVLNKPYPKYGITPDSDFPLVYGEKGIINFNSRVSVNAPEVLSFKGGVATNAVCDRFDINLKNPDDFEEYLRKEKINFERNDNEISVLGKTAHGSTPEAGINAALIGLKALGDFYNIPIFKKIGEDLDSNGKRFGGYHHTDLLGDTTYCLGIISYKDNELNFITNFRHPDGVNPAEIVNVFDNYFGVKSTLGEHSPHLLFDPNSPLVQTLLKAYREETGDMTPPFTIGGGTYAKHAKNTLAFGAMFPGTISTMHEPNERMAKKDIELSTVIYAHALFDLANLK